MDQPLENLWGGGGGAKYKKKDLFLVVYLFVEGRKAKNLFPPREGRQVVPKKIS